MDVDNEFVSVEEIGSNDVAIHIRYDEIPSDFQARKNADGDQTGTKYPYASVVRGHQ